VRLLEVDPEGADVLDEGVADHRERLRLCLVQRHRGATDPVLSSAA
jgi:hypothetical protein